MRAAQPVTLRARRLRGERRIRDTSSAGSTYDARVIMCAGAMHGGAQQLGVGGGVRSGQPSRHVPAATPARGGRAATRWTGCGRARLLARHRSARKRQIAEVTADPPCCSCGCTTPADPDSTGILQPPRGRRRGRVVRRLRTRRPAQPSSDRSDDRTRHRHRRRVPQAVDRRDRPRHRRRDHHGMRRRLPGLPGKRYEEWTLDDPAGLGVAAVRPIRDEIERRVFALLDQLGATARL
jgi:hypothetical protein